MSRRLQIILPLVLGTVVGAVFVGFMAYTAGRGDPRDLLARWVRVLGLTPITGAVAGACLGAAIGGVVAGLSLRHLADLAALSREMNLSLSEEVPAEAVTEVKRRFPNLEIRAPSNWLAGKHDGLEVRLLDCTIFEKNALAPAGTCVRKTVVFVFGELHVHTSFELRARGPGARWPFSMLVSGMRSLAAAFGSGPQVERHFRKNYDLLWLDRYADSNIIRRLLGPDALSFFAEQAGWWLVVEKGGLAAWQQGLAESDAAERRAMVEHAVNFYRWLAAAAAECAQDRLHHLQGALK